MACLRPYLPALDEGDKSKGLDWQQRMMTWLLANAIMHRWPVARPEISESVRAQRVIRKLQDTAAGNFRS